MLLIVSEFYIFSSEAVLNEILLIISLYLAPGLPGERTWQFLAHPPKNELPDYLGGDTGEGSNHPLRVQARRCCGVKFEPAPFGLPTTGVKWTKPKQNQPGAFEPDLDAGRKLIARNIAQLSLLKVN